MKPESSSPLEEREVKLRVPDLERARRALQDAGAEPVEPETLEDNQLFDLADGSLAQGDALLRLRDKRPLSGQSRGRRATLTYKGPARIEGGVRVREELETKVDDGAILRAMLGRLGFRPGFRYQKRRELVRLHGALVAIDDTPLGSFVEAEGSDEAIAQVAAVLGLGPDDYEVASYPALWTQHCGEERHMLFEDGTEAE